jgi:uncharacterized protein (TIGR03435 family)
MIRPLVALGFLGSIAVLSAQTPAQQPAGTPAFEVASVKPVPPGSNRTGYRPQPTRFSGYFTVAEAVAFAYQIERTRVVGGPSWAREQRYEINATTATRKPGDINAMMRRLLEERFSLKAHREQRPIPVHTLSLSRSGGGLGPGLQRVELDCTRPAVNPSGCSVSFGAGHFRANGHQWKDFIGSLETRISGRPVLDKTGLSGQFDIALEWTADVTRVPDVVSTDPSLADVEAPPALFTAMREQLGLKLESGTAAMEVIVIDSVDRPTPD